MRYKSLGGLALLLVALAIAIYVVPHKSSASSLGWIETPNITIDKVRVLGQSESVPKSLNGNIDCSDQKITTRPAKSHPEVLIAQSEITQTVCMSGSQFGNIGNGYLEAPDTPVAGQIYDSGGSLQTVVQVPNGSAGVFLERGASSGSYVSIVDDLKTQIKPQLNSDYSLRYNLKESATKRWVKNSSGQAIALQYPSMSFSRDGNWMIADSPYAGHVRVNLSTGETLMFGQALPYDNGSNPELKTAVSSNGRYVAIYSYTYSIFKIYDLESCSGGSNGFKSCANKDLSPQLRQANENKGGVVQMRFLTDNYIRMYGRHREGEKLVDSEYAITVGGNTNKIDYLALGDSFASGEGAFAYKTGTDSNENKCHLSTVSYPFLVGDRRGYNSSQSVACSGAVLNDIINLDNENYLGQDTLKIPYKARLSSSIFSGFFTGQISQLRFVNQYRPSKITVSIGGNNFGFGKKIVSCVLNDEKTNDTCFNTYDQRKAIVNEAKATIGPLRDSYIQLRAVGSDVYVIGYPKLVKAGGVYCKANVHLNEQETSLADDLTEIINNAVETAAKQAGVFYVDTEDALVGHRLCETPDSVQIAVHGLTAGNDRGKAGVKFLGAESYHPNVLGQRLYADAVLDKSYNMTGSMPNPDPSATFPEPSESDPFLTSFPKTAYSPALKPRFVDMSLGNSIIKKSVIKFRIKNFPLKPTTMYRVVAHSTPIDMGQVITNGDGEIDQELTLPDGLNPGYHSLHVLGQNIAGENVDLYDYFLITDSVIDFDGNGISDTSEGCVVVPNSGIDEDKDEIDDSCDSEIGPAPPEVPQVDEEEINSNTSDLLQPTEPVIDPGTTELQETAPPEILPPAEIIVLPDVPNDPQITPVAEEADKDGLGESVAGLEVLVTPEPTPVITTNSSDTSSSQVPWQNIVTTRTPVANSGTVDTSVVLGQSGALDSAVTQATPVPQSTVNNIVANDVDPTKEPNYTLWYVVGGVFGMIIVILLARRYTTAEASANKN